MTIAFAEAQEAFGRGEYPVGAVLLRDGEIIAKAGNRCVADVDPTAHAEMLVIREGYKKLRSVSDCTLYTTLYPCPMCEKAIVEVGIRRVVYGATSFKWIREHKFVNLVPVITGPVMQAECRGLFEKRLEENGRSDILEFERR